jgi:hypothetical protein
LALGNSAMDDCRWQQHIANRHIQC